MKIASLPAVPDWLNKGVNAWQLTLVCLSMGLVLFYASTVKKKWAFDSAFMALCAFAAFLICWVLFCYNLAFGDELFPLWESRPSSRSTKGIVNNVGNSEAKNCSRKTF